MNRLYNSGGRHSLKCITICWISTMLGWICSNLVGGKRCVGWVFPIFGFLLLFMFSGYVLRFQICSYSIESRLWLRVSVSGYFLAVGSMSLDLISYFPTNLLLCNSTPAYSHVIGISWDDPSDSFYYGLLS